MASLASPLGAVGFDVSMYQGNMNWPGLRAIGAQVAIPKVGQFPGYRDSGLIRHRDGARAAGLALGYYWYADPDTDPLHSARDFVTMSGRRDGEPMFLDVEDPGLTARWVNTFLTVCDEALPGSTRCHIYTYWSYLAEHPWLDACIGTRGLWLAVYNSSASVPDWHQAAPRGMHTIGHQFTSTPRFGGLPSSLDVNLFYGGVPAFRALGSSTGATPTVTAPAPTAGITQPVGHPGFTYTPALSLDCSWGPATQAKFLGLLGLPTEDTIISDQYPADAAHWPACHVIHLAGGNGGSTFWKTLQNYLNRALSAQGVSLKEDGYGGEKSAKALQKWLGVAEDGMFGPVSTQALQRRLNGITAVKQVMN